MHILITELVFFLILMIVPAVLWIVPGTRRKNGAWMIALKTVPLGLYVFNSAVWGMLFSAVRRLPFDRSGEYLMIPLWLQICLPLLAAFLVIIPAGLFIRRKFGAEKEYDPVLSILLFFLLLPPVMVIDSVLAIGVSIACYSRDPAGYRGEWDSTPLPPEGDTRITFDSQSIHPFLAEYNYRISFSRGKSVVFRQLLFVNCGGRTHFNLYRLKDGRLFFQDKDWDYLVDVPEQKVYMLGSFEGKVYAAPVPNEEIHSWGGPERQQDGKITFSLNLKKIPAEDVSGILDGMVYYGCIRWKFHPAAEMPEEPIQLQAGRGRRVPVNTTK